MGEAKRRLAAILNTGDHINPQSEGGASRRDNLRAPQTKQDLEKADKSLKHRRNIMMPYLVALMRSSPCLTGHVSAEERDKIIDDYLEYERDARARGRRL